MEHTTRTEDGVDPRIDLADGVLAAEREAAAEPDPVCDGDHGLDADPGAGCLVVEVFDPDPGPDDSDAHLDDGDAGLWADRSHALDAAMTVTVGEPAWTIDVLADATKANSMIAWTEYREIGAMHAHLTLHGKPQASARGVRMIDIETQAAARIAMSQGLTQHQGDKWLAEAIAMRDRLPKVGEQLRVGTITPRQFRRIVAQTELIDDQDWAPEVDAAIADILGARGGAGTWSNRRLTDMVDRIIFRHDPDAVRRRHEKAKKARSAWILPGSDGMATLGATMTAHNAAIAYNAVLALAAMVCPHDTRSRDARSSDALFALLTGTAFECDCARDDCAAEIPDPDALAVFIRDRENTATAKGRVLVHVIADQATVDGRDDNPAFMDGHGVISAAHLRDLLARDDVRVRPINPTGDQNSGDNTGSGVSLPTHLPSDPYRPSTALDTFVRARDGYCTTPGCDQPAWKCDIDHVAEYDHDDPNAGGQTRPDELGAKCRMHHNFKSFAEGWVDDQYRNPQGRLVSEVVSPEKVRFPGPAETNADLFPSLDTISWHDPSPDLDTAAPSSQPHDHRESTTVKGRRPRDRTKAKHARRRAERAANRRHRLAEEWRDAEQEYHRRHEHPRETDGDPPF
jgi:hypothetical protein